MHRFAFVLLFVIFVSACSPVATPVPVPTATNTPTTTATIPPADITAAATFIRTLPASFTPTFTPSLSPSPTTTYTPTPLPTATIVPEDVLCEEFKIGSVLRNGQVNDDFKQVFIPFDAITITGEIYNADTGELVDSGTLSGNHAWTFEFSASVFPEPGNYEWVFSLSDNEREGLCERRGTFETGAQATAEPTAEATVELSPELTPESTVELIAESTEAIEAESTEEAPGTTFRFPPR